MKKRGIITGIAVIAVLIIGIAALVSYNPAEDKDEKTIKERRTVLELDTADEITVKSDEVNLTFINDDGVWYIEGIGKSEISQQKAGMFIRNALSYKTDALLEKSDEYGFDAPAAEITIKEGETEHTVKIGAKSAVADVYFAAADDIIFTMPSSQYDILLRDLAYYTSFERLAIDVDEITEFNIASEDRTIDIYLRDITNFEGNVWQMRKPYNTLANDTYIDSVILENLAAVSLSEKAETLGEVRAVLTVIADGETYEFKIGSQNGGSVNILYDGEVYSEPRQLFEFVSADTFEFVNKLVSYTHINDISSYTVSYDGKEHTTVISGTDGSFAFKSDGKAADADESKAVYREIIGVVATGLYNNEPTGDTVLSVVFTGKDGTTLSTVEYKTINEYTAAVEKDGEIIFVTGFADVNNLKDKLNIYFN